MRRSISALGILLLGVYSGVGVPASAQDPAVAQDRPTLELSLDEVVQRALENNANLAVLRFDPVLSRQDVERLEGYYEPLLSATLDRTKTTLLPRDRFTPEATITGYTWDFGLNQPLLTGGTVALDFNNSRRASGSPFASFSPSFESSLTASLRQPLLRNFRIDFNRQQIRIAKKSAEISDVQFRQSVVATVATVKEVYYDLISAIDSLDAARKNLALAKKSLDENQIRVRVGTMAPLDVVTAESEVASRDEGVIVAENALHDAEDRLKQAIFPANDPAAWALRILPKDRPSADPYPVDLETATRNALQQRTDITVARKSLERADYTIHYARNQLLPAVDLIASYGGGGIGGTQLLGPDGEPLVPPIPGGYGDALSSVFGQDFPSWRVGFNVSFPFLNRQAKVYSAQATVSKQQAEASLRRLELAIAAEIRAAGRAVETNFRRVQATRAARTLAAQRLDAEEKKFAAGMSTNFFVIQAQRDLALEDNREIRAIADYRKSIINYEAAQEAGISGSGGTVQLVPTR
jgi:outer membrane protein